MHLSIESGSSSLPSLREPGDAKIITMRFLIQLYRFQRTIGYHVLIDSANVSQ